jgi:hypothetical protein
MSLKEEIAEFRDQYGMVNLWRSRGTEGSDNGPMFTSEYIIMLLQNQQAWMLDVTEYKVLMWNCMKDGLLSRKPGDSGQEGPDDYHGVLAACSVLNDTLIPRQILHHGMRNFGFFNNQNPNSFTKNDGSIAWEAFLWRMPQLLALNYAAARIWRPWVPLLNAYAALIIATSCIGVPTGDTDPRRLSWLLIQGMHKSWLCKLAAKLWWARLKRDYGVDGMRAVARIYYPKDEHPFQRYWKNAWEL